MGDWEQKKNLINELLQGMELARQLQSYLNVSSSLSPEALGLLIQKIIATFEKALAMVKWNSGSVAEPSQAMIRMSDSPPFSGSPRSDDSDRDVKDQDLNALQKRKSLPTWTHKVRVTPGGGVEVHLDDGFSWRKYGQKDILGAKYPRGYYRCTQRIQGCLATKQVQRSDEDPTIFEINYRGKHTCTQGSNSVPPMGPQHHNQESSNIPTMSQQLQNLQLSQELLMSLRENLRMKTENLDSPQKPFPSSHFPSTSSIESENQVFPDPMTTERSFSANFSSPSYLSPPATSGSNYFSVSPSEFGGQPNMASSGSGINDMISASNTPTVGFEPQFDQFEFQQNLTFGNPRFFF